MNRRRLFGSACFVVALFVRATLVMAQSPHSVVDAKGFQQNRDYFSELPFEHIDTLSGSLVLRFTDLVLPGNAGRELRFTRTYNNKFPGAGWTFGVAGVVMRITDPPYPPPGTPEKIIARPQFHTSDGADQVALWMHGPGTATDATIRSSMRWVSTHQFGRYDRVAMKLYLPDGRICDDEPPATAERRVRICTDAFGNRVQFQWYPTYLLVTQHFHPTEPQPLREASTLQVVHVGAFSTSRGSSYRMAASARVRAVSR